MEQVNACDDERVVQITDMTLEKSLPWFTRVVNDVTNKGPIESAKCFASLEWDLGLPNESFVKNNVISAFV
ncbi:unnamed protein product, partial [Brenthis ino]